MVNIERNALVLYGPDKMYDLVRDVIRYPEFLSWCTGSRVLEESHSHQIASLRLKVAGMETAFITQNHLVENESLQMQLRDGPFTTLEGGWHFAPLGDVGCKITLKMNFEFKQRWLAAAFSQGFTRVADRLVDDFCRRADQLYTMSVS